MISIATALLWIFLIVFSVSAAFSVRDLQFDFGEPQVQVSANHQLLFSLPINISNKGYYNVGSFGITTEISDADNLLLARGSTLTNIIRKGERITIFHNVALNTDDLWQRNPDYLFNDTQLNVAETVSMKIAEVIPVQAYANSSIPWGAPLRGFRFEEPAFEFFNSTHFRVDAPISFENRASFDISGNVQVRMYNSAGALVGDDQTAIDVSQHHSYKEHLTFHVLMTTATSSGHFDVYFLTSLFNYGPLVIPYG